MIPRVDTFGAFALACGAYGWTPDDFWGAQLYEVSLALQEGTHTRMEWMADHAAFVTNGVRVAFHAEDYDKMDGSDFYQRDPERAVEDLKKEKEELSSSLPATLD